MRAAPIKIFGEPTEVLELADVPEPSGPAAGRFFTPRGAERCSSVFVERPELKTHA